MPATDAPETALGTISAHTQYAWPSTERGIDEPDQVPDLQWPASVTVYARMQYDPTVMSVLASYIRPIVNARWSIDPRGASPAAVALCADSLGLPVLGQPDDPGPWRRRGVRWKSHIEQAAQVMLTFGHAPYEPVYDTTTGTAVLSALEERLPASIEAVTTNRDGSLRSIRQRSWDEWRGVEIPADRLLWYVRARQGAAWQGVSLLRHAYGSWLIKQDLLRVQGTTLRRFGAPTPTLEQLPGATPTQAQVVQAQAAAQAVRVGETGGMTTPGFRLRLVGAEGTVPDSLPTIQYLDQQIARGALTSVLDLANTGTGNRALGEVFANALTLALESVADLLAETATGLCVRLVDFNEGDTGDVPAVHVDMASSRAAIAESIGVLVGQGGLVMDDDLQEWIRDALGLPAPAPSRPAPALPAPPVPVAEDDQGDTEDDARPGSPVTAAAADWPYRRPLTEDEEAAGFDPAAIDAAHAAVLGALLAAWPEITATWTASLIEQVRAAIDAGDLAAVAALTVDTGDAAALIEAAMTDAAQAGKATAVAEAAAQDVAAPVGITVPVAGLAAVAAVTAALMGQSFAAAAGRETVRLVGASGATAVDVPAAVAVFLESLSGTYAQDVLGGAVSDGIEAGRQATFQAIADELALDMRVVASEVRDASTCPACKAIDGTVYDSLEEASADYPAGHYAQCAGRERCRGTLTIIWEEGQ